MGQALSTVLVIWGVIGLVTILVAANALADFGAKRLRERFGGARQPGSTTPQQ